jgi:hypothetical protein
MAKGRKTGGRVAGVPNRMTKAFKEAVLIAYNGIGGDEAFIGWAKENQTEFYKIASRLIPHEVAGPGQDGANLIKTIVHVHEVVKADN